MPKRLFLFLCLLFLAWTPGAYAASDLQAGFRTLGVWEPAKALRLNLAIWYPTKRSPSQVDYGDWTFRAARNATPVPGKHPLILLSHDSAGSRFSLHALAAALAESGFVVAAPTHPGDNTEDMSALFTLRHLAGRAADLSGTLDILLTNAVTEPMIDPQRIGVLGVGPGGTAALLLAGGRLDPAGWADYCAKSALASQAAGSDVVLLPEPLYCTPWSAKRMGTLALEPSLGEKRRDTRVRVAAAVAPWYGMFFSPRSLSRIRIPLLLMNAENDLLNPAIFHVEAIRKALPSPPMYTKLEQADASALLSPCSATLADTWPELCLSAAGSRRNKVQEALASEASSFFLTHLATPNPPPLPAEPPDLPESSNSPEEITPQPEAKPAATPVTKPQRGRRVNR